MCINLFLIFLLLCVVFAFYLLYICGLCCFLGRCYYICTLKKQVIIMVEEEKDIHNLLTRIRKINDLEGRALISSLSIKDTNLMYILIERNFITAKENVHDLGSNFSHVQIKSSGIDYLNSDLNKEIDNVWNIDRRLFFLGSILIPLLGLVIMLLK